MMKRKSLITAAISLAILLSACKGPASPAETMQPPNENGQQSSQQQSSPSKSVMDGFEELKSKNSTPGELMKFIEPKIGNLEKQDADKVVKELLKVQELQLENYNDKIMAEDFNIKLNSLKYEDLKSLNIKDEEIKTVLKNAFDDGYMLSASEGMFYLEIDFVSMNSKFAQFVSGEAADYLEIMAEESGKHFADDAALTISLEELADRVVKTEAFIDKYKDSTLLDGIKIWHKNYLSAYLIGLNNTPAFEYDNNKVKLEVMQSFKNTVAKYPESKLAAILKDYTALIEKNDGKKTQAVLNFANKAAN